MPGVDFLLQMRVDDARNCGHALPELLCHAQVGLPVIADGPHVDLGRKAEIEDLGDDIGGLEIEFTFGTPPAAPARSLRT